ncbi:MAG: glycosyltransferase family 4 protein [Parcubacteria group bacterium]|nr:glycosyltransferase family 4 protein [Parcubacteria group bacterium]
MKIYFLYNVIEGPFGGANQFFKMLKRYLGEKGVVTESPEEADIIVFNSHSFGGGKGGVFSKVLALRKSYPEKLFVHRVDGPVNMYRGKKRLGIDREIYRINALVSDATVFQSYWSKKENKRRGMADHEYEVVIVNAPDPDIFYPGNDASTALDSGRIRIIATSWSHHEGKGFDIYRFLDEHLDYGRYEMTFIGNSPVSFKHIRMIPPLESRVLAQKLRESDMFITASKNDPCSNALLEALHSGLPAVVRSSGGHPELIGKGGEVFTDTTDVLAVIDRVAHHISDYRSHIAVSSMEEVGSRYLAFFECVVQEARPRVLPPVAIFFLSLRYGVFRYIRILKSIYRRMLKKVSSVL